MLGDLLSDKNYITPAGLERLKSEYHQLFHIERPRVVETVAWAASNGDRSENADYLYGKKRLREIDKQVRILIQKIENAEVVDPVSVKSKQVLFGATVTVENSDGQVRKFHIVGEDEWDVSQNKISWRSPMAKALLGRQVEDEVRLQRPTGEEFLIILKIEYKPI